MLGKFGRLNKLNIDKESSMLRLERRGLETSRVTDRTLAHYEEVLGIKVKEMKGKKVLEIGAGLHDEFKTEAEALGVNVVSITPDKGEGEYFKLEPVPPSVYARAQQLPFKDNTFDFIVSSYAVPMYLPRRVEEYKAFIDEALRVLRVGGKAYFFPVTNSAMKILAELSTKNKKYTSVITLNDDNLDTNPRLILTKKQ